MFTVQAARVVVAESVIIILCEYVAVVCPPAISARHTHFFILFLSIFSFFFVRTLF